jgi:hypothetical protein
MNIMLIRGSVPTLLDPPPTGQHRDCHRWRQRKRASGTTQTTFAGRQDLTDSCPVCTLNTDIGMHV